MRLADSCCTIVQQLLYDELSVINGTVSESSETSATWWTTSTGTTHRWPAAPSGTSSTEAGTITRTVAWPVLLASEDIDAEVDMQHDVAVDGVVFCIRPHRGGDGSAEVALLMEQVIELKHDGERFAFEEALRELHVPYKLVGVERVVGVAAA